MIGGKDTWFPVSKTTPSLDVAVRTLRRQWPKAVFDDAQTGKRWHRYEDINFAQCREILVYRDLKTAADWDDLGAIDALRNTMIHLVVASGGLTIVTDASPSQQIQSLISAIEKALHNDIFFIKAAA